MLIVPTGKWSLGTWQLRLGPSSTAGTTMSHFCPIWSLSQWVTYPVCPVYPVYADRLQAETLGHHHFQILLSFKKNISPFHPPPPSVTMNRT